MKTKRENPLLPSKRTQRLKFHSTRGKMILAKVINRLNIWKKYLLQAKLRYKSELKKLRLLASLKIEVN